MRKLFILLSWIVIFLIAGATYIYRSEVSELLNKFVATSSNSFNTFTESVNKEFKQVYTPSEKVTSLAPVPHGTSTLTATGILNETNSQRAQFGLPALLGNAKLSAAAKIKADDMLRLDYFEHISPSGVGPADLANAVDYEYILIGENLAMGFFKGDFGVVEAWMNSPGHRANILNPRYTELGVYAVKGDFEGEEVWMAVQEFGKPISDCPAINSSLKAQIDANNSQLNSLSIEMEKLKAEIDAHNPKRGSEYNRKVDEYKSLVEEYNSLVNVTKTLIAEYNSQISAFNACAQG